MPHYKRTLLIFVIYKSTITLITHLLLTLVTLILLWLQC